MNYGKNPAKSAVALKLFRDRADALEAAGLRE